jgi:hypothetical protein
LPPGGGNRGPREDRNTPAPTQVRSSVAQCLWVDGAAGAEPAAVARDEFAANGTVALSAGVPLPVLAVRYTDVTHGERAHRRSESSDAECDAVCWCQAIAPPSQLTSRTEGIGHAPPRR